MPGEPAAILGKSTSSFFPFFTPQNWFEKLPTRLLALESAI
jgi:hypothetical protein